MKTIYFDIETGPLPESEVQPFMPEFSAPANYKDPEKIAASIQEQKKKWLADGALSAVTGRVLAIGWTEDSKPNVIYGDEHENLVLEDWWNIVRTTLQARDQLVGFCCKSFDLPFLVRRSWKLGVAVPSCLWQSNRRYWSDQIVDVAELWSCAGRDPRDRISLDNLSKFLGTGAKNGDGVDFASLWAIDRPKAISYLENDLRLTKAAYERLNP